jgi:hypothetical protein
VARRGATRWFAVVEGNEVVVVAWAGCGAVRRLRFVSSRFGLSALLLPHTSGGGVWWPVGRVDAVRGRRLVVSFVVCFFHQYFWWELGTCDVT